MIIRSEYLIKRNDRNKIQFIHLQLDQFTLSSFTIYRSGGQYGGKERSQPSRTFTSGKANRTIAEQATLYYNSLINNYLNRGYKLITPTLNNKDLSEYSIEYLLSLVNDTTDANGIPKPMLAKSSNDLSSSIFEKEVYVSRKIDGVRCLMYYKNGEILTASRGGKDYNASTTHLRTSPDLITLFQHNPNLILDGELYYHGWSLQKISGLCRLQTPTEECKELEYWIYDYIDNIPFSVRYMHLLQWKEVLVNPKIKILTHILVMGWLKIKKLHDQFVQEGFEGLCARNPEREYGIGKRSGLYLWKLKERLDDEFKIVGVREGMRPEDMCFILETSRGKQFAAKPACSTEQRLEYLNNKDSYIGKMGTCTYFYLSQDKVPLQPVFKFVREEEDLPN